MALVYAAAPPPAAAAAAVAEGKLQSQAVHKCYWCLPGQGGPVALALVPFREVQQPCPWRLQGEGGGPDWFKKEDVIKLPPLNVI